MRVVRAGDDLYVRSAHGPDDGWYRRAVSAGHGRIGADGVETDIDVDVIDVQRRLGGRGVRARAKRAARVSAPAT